MTLTAVVDSCHSGSVFDLPFTMDITEETIAAFESGELTLKPNDSFDLEVKTCRLAGSCGMFTAATPLEIRII